QGEAGEGDVRPVHELRCGVERVVGCRRRWRSRSLPPARRARICAACCGRAVTARARPANSRMSRGARTFLTLVIVCASLAVFVPAASAVPISVACNGGGCATGWYTSSVTVAFTWDPAGVVMTQNCDTNTVSSDTSGWSRTCVVTYTNDSTSQLGVTI